MSGNTLDRIAELIAQIRALPKYDCHGADGDYRAGMEPGTEYVSVDDLEDVLRQYER